MVTWGRMGHKLFFGPMKFHYPTCICFIPWRVITTGQFWILFLHECSPSAYLTNCTGHVLGEYLPIIVLYRHGKIIINRSLLTSYSDSNSNSNIVYCFLFTVLVIHTFILFQVQYHTYIIHTCQATSNISGSPIEGQWDLLKYQGQPDRYHHGHIHMYQRVNTLHT